MIKVIGCELEIEVSVERFLVGPCCDVHVCTITMSLLSMVCIISRKESCPRWSVKLSR